MRREFPMSVFTFIPQFFSETGFVAIPLVGVGLLGIYAASKEILLRLGFRKKRQSLIRMDVLDSLRRGYREVALLQAEQDPEDPVLAIAAVALRNDFDKQVTREASLASPLFRTSWIVDPVTIISPMIGILGTVVAMISLAAFFKDFSLENTPIVLGAIFQALLTTGYGILVGLFVYSLKHFVVIPLRDDELSSAKRFLLTAEKLASNNGRKEIEEFSRIRPKSPRRKPPDV